MNLYSNNIKFADLSISVLVNLTKDNIKVKINFQTKNKKL